MPQLINACPLKEEALRAGNPKGEALFDLLIVRELTGGLYFGEQGRRGDTAFDTESYSRGEIERALQAGYQAAGRRRGKLCVVDKANVLESSRLWRETAETVSKAYPHIETSYMYVDNCAMQLIRAPGQFDVLVTSNLFGDILSDEAAALTGSIGMLPSASLGNLKDGRPAGLYEPIHGSAPDLAGRDQANPIGAILSAAMMLRYSFGMEEAARRIEQAVASALAQGLRTRDIACCGPEERTAGTKEMGEAVRRCLR
jgi:3-isopropylmalate dehydrogenase